jgi:hypothetical protein
MRGLKRAARCLHKMQTMMLRTEMSTTDSIGQDSTQFDVRMGRSIDHNNPNAIEDAAFTYNPNSDDPQWSHCTLRTEGDRLVEVGEGEELGENNTTLGFHVFEDANWEDMLQMKVYCKLPND